ncbi:hypothetical protein PEC301877_10860 [Pectobacterium carotovorum subsp. carotovorum]|nr:hypothetical protein PEC301877_10860 [Pectobacterium carotovorum subsp. carotovorum]
MASVYVHCPRCQSVQVYRHGQNPKGRDRFRCRDCHRVFLLTYTYEARKPGVKEQISEMAFNGAGVRDTARTLKIGINTVIRTLGLVLNVWLVKQSASHARLNCMKKSSGRSLKNTCSTNWMHHPLLFHWAFLSHVSSHIVVCLCRIRYGGEYYRHSVRGATPTGGFLYDTADAGGQSCHNAFRCRGTGFQRKTPDNGAPSFY